MATVPTKEITLTSDITVRLVQSMGGDAMVVAAARVSTSGEAALACASLPADEQGGLIRYLMKHRHGTPFEHSALTFFVHAPIFVWREWHRHRIGFSYNEESGRYKTLDSVFYLPPRDRPMMKVDGWKPGRPKFTRCGDDGVYAALCHNLTESYQLSYANYEKNLSLGIDPGLARDCLPVGIYSSCWVTCNPRSLMAFLSLRTHEPESAFPSYPLYEIEEAARACEKIFEAGWPLTYGAFCACGRVAP
jgi:thymidylate synthase (FAD)